MCLLPLWTRIKCHLILKITQNLSKQQSKGNDYYKRDSTVRLWGGKDYNPSKICVFQWHMHLYFTPTFIFMILGRTERKKRKTMHTCAFIINQILTLKPYFASGWKIIPWEKNNKQQNKTVNLYLHT